MASATDASDDDMVTVETTVLYTAFVTAVSDSDVITATLSTLTSLPTSIPFSISTSPTATVSSIDQASSVAPISTLSIDYSSTSSSIYSPLTSGNTSQSSDASQSTSTSPSPRPLPPVEAPTTTPSSTRLSTSSTPTSDGSQSPTSPVGNAIPAASSVSTAAASPTEVHRSAIIGGLVGAIGGTMLIAILILLCCCIRRRRKQNQETYQNHAQPQISDMKEMSFGYAAPLAKLHRTSSKSNQLADGSLIRISLEHFERPFVTNEGWRESVKPGRLRVMNPDRSLPPTPSVSSEWLPGFFGKRTPEQPKNVEKRVVIHHEKLLPVPPAIYIDDRLSKECIAPSVHGAPSFRSYPSVDTLPLVVQRPPEDPFVTAEQRPKQQLARPALSPVQSVASRTWSSLSTAFKLSRTKSSLMIDSSVGNRVISASNYSVHSSRVASTVSDQFDLESPVLRSYPQKISMNESIAYMSPKQRQTLTYDGT